MSEEDKDRQEYFASTKLDEAVYALLELGWDAEQIHDKVEDLVEQFEGGEPDD